VIDQVLLNGRDLDQELAAAARDIDAILARTDP
jgi:hypothetical protein